MAGPWQITCAELQAMRSIPASNLPVYIRTELAVILDPPKDCPNRDYRYFAEKLGLQPQVCHFLDAQKCHAETSSTRLIIKYLIDERGDSFKIFDIYEALMKMGLKGPEIILNYVRSNLKNWRSLWLDTRPGQQNQEASLCTCRQCQQDIGLPARSPNYPSPYFQHPPFSTNSDSTPPSYREAVGPLVSMVDCHGGSTYVHSPDHRGCMQGGARQTNGNILPLHGPDSFLSGDHITPHQWIWEHSNNTSVDQSGVRAPHQDCQFNQLSFIPPSNGSASRDDNPQNNSSWNIPPQSECFQNSIIENQVSSGAMSQESSATVSFRAGSGRPASFPSGSLPSDAMSQLPARPVSDGYFCSHQGACNCSLYHADDRGSQRCFPIIPSSSTDLQQCTDLTPSGRYEYPSPQQTTLHPSMSPHPQLNTRVNSNRSVDLYTEQSYPHPSVSPYSANSMVSQHQPAGNTNHIKQYVFNITIPNRKEWKDKGNAGKKQPKTGDPGHSPRKPGVTTGQTVQRKKQPKTGDPGHSPRKPGVITGPTVQNHHGHFVLVLAGDTRLGNELANQVRNLEQTLREYEIPHVIVTSTSQQPIVWLTQAQWRTLPALQGGESSVSTFVDACYRRAKKILIAVSPGYVLYADEYVNGAKKSENTMQEIIRRQHEEMKDERANSSIHRLWPLLLHPLKTNRTHIPNFLTSVLFYWFGKRNVENFAVVLQSELQVDTHQNRI